jgi:transposase
MDVHKESIHIAALSSRTKEASRLQIENKPQIIATAMKRLLKESGGDLVVCYEAGPCGFALFRQLEELGVTCKVIAPALIPRRPGDRVKTDRRDAAKLASLLKADLLTEVHPPTKEQEAVRDLCRARDDIRDDLMRARHRLSKFLLRHGRVFDGRQWTMRHTHWIREQAFDILAEQLTLDLYREAVDTLTERQRALDEKIAKIADTPAYKDAVGALRCFRGIDTTTAMILVSELGDVSRFKSAPQLMAYLGITPSEYSSGGPAGRRLGGITKTGNRHVRRVLIECAWHYRHSAAVGTALKRRRQGQPVWAIAVADKCQRRLCKKHRALIERGKPSPKANVAVARELAGFIWGALIEEKKRKVAA